MPDAAQPVVVDPKGRHCPRCLQAVPPRASRCPGCGQPVHSTRLLTFAIGIIGLFVLLFAMLVMYKLANDEEAATAPAPVDEDSNPQPLFPEAPAASTADDPGKPKEPAKPDEPPKPEKKPPLNER